MKKHYLLTLCIIYITAWTSHAQEKKLNSGISISGNSREVASPIDWNQPGFNSTSTTSKWLGYWLVEDNFATSIQNTPQSYRSELFDDSSAVVCDIGPCYHVHVHMIGNVLDINSQDLQSAFTYSVDTSATYFVDSIELSNVYRRTTGPGITDALIAYWWDDQDTNDINRKFHFLPPVGLGSEPYSDTIWFGGLNYDSTGTNRPDVKGVLDSLVIPLNVADTANRILKFSVNHFTLPPGKLFASAFKFIPGYTYPFPGDTITQANDFEFVSDQPNGVGHLGPYTKHDYNVSYIINDAIRYKSNPDSLGGNGLFLPSYGFGPDYQTQQHRITYLVSGVHDVGVKENQPMGGIQLFQNHPNPANKTTDIGYSLKSAGSVSVLITDLTGRVVLTLNEGNQSPGAHVVNVNISGLSQGMYLYTLKANNESLTKRMVISE